MSDTMDKELYDFISREIEHISEVNGKTILSVAMDYIAREFNNCCEYRKYAFSFPQYMDTWKLIQLDHEPYVIHGTKAVQVKIGNMSWSADGWSIMVTLPIDNEGAAVVTAFSGRELYQTSEGCLDAIEKLIHCKTIEAMKREGTP